MKGKTKMKVSIRKLKLIDIELSCCASQPKEKLDQEERETV